MKRGSRGIPPTAAGTRSRWLARAGLAAGAVAASLVLAELGLRVAGFEYHLHPERLEFGYPDPKVLEEWFVQHDEYLWVARRVPERLARARAERPHLVFTGCSCTEWGGFDEALAKRVAETPGLAPLTYANLASSGWTSYQGLQLLKRDVSEIGPKVVTVFYGWNDHWMGFGVDDETAAELSSSFLLELQELRVVQLATRAVVAHGPPSGRGADARPERVSLDDFRSNLREMVDVARSHGITPVLITAPTSHVEGEEPEYLRERWLEDLSRLVPLHRAYVEAVREVAAEESAVLCDLARVFDALPREELLRYMKDDGIHFTPEGGEKVADLLFECLVEHGLLAADPGAGEEKP